MSIEKGSETFDDVELQSLSDVETIEAEVYATTSRTSPLFSFDSLNIFRLRKESSEDYIDNEIKKSDVIEIEVPVIGSEYMRKNHDKAVDNRKGYAEIDIFTTPSTFDLSTSEDILTFSPSHFQGSPSQESSVENTFETTTTAATEALSTDTERSVIDVIQSMESKLMEHRNYFPESEMLTVKSRSRPKFPFNVKIVVNNEDERKSCRSKTSCSQVSFSRPKNDIDHKYYSDYSDEDVFHRPEIDRYFELANDLRPRNVRGVNDGELITPAPRFPPMRGIKKPSFIERLENESSIERSERINKNLDGLMRFVSVVAQVDKFVSDRARTVVRRIAHMAGDDYDDITLGSPRKRVDTKRMINDPFT